MEAGAYPLQFRTNAAFAEKRLDLMDLGELNVKIPGLM
jgi:hypothetical protein